MIFERHKILLMSTKVGTQCARLSWCPATPEMNRLQTWVSHNGICNLLDHPTDLINDTETRYQLPRYRILRAEIEWIMINCLLLSPTTAFRIETSFMAHHMAITLPLRKLFTQHQKLCDIHLEAVHDKIPKLFTSNL